MHGVLAPVKTRVHGLIDMDHLPSIWEQCEFLRCRRPSEVSDGPRRLHNEIISFYHWVKPRPFEDVIRTDLITRLETHMQNRFPGSQLHAFGSYASGLYLPVADVDLVLLSRSFIRQGRKFLCQKPRDIYALAAYLRDVQIAVPGSIETIPHARVPIIKFIDRLTGLKVDLSFDNSSGLAAVRTFQQWRNQFPAMPLIVSVIKQFLLFRGLNEVPTGGLGGFSIICLVTSLLQHLPHGTSEPNLGGVLMDFFDFYGNNFDFSTVGIEFNPPGYFHKVFTFAVTTVVRTNSSYCSIREISTKRIVEIEIDFR